MLPADPNHLQTGRSGNPRPTQTNGSEDIMALSPVFQTILIEFEQGIVAEIRASEALDEVEIAQIAQIIGDHLENGAPDVGETIERFINLMNLSDTLHTGDLSHADMLRQIEETLGQGVQEATESVQVNGAEDMTQTDPYVNDVMRSERVQSRFRDRQARSRERDLRHVERLHRRHLEQQERRAQRREMGAVHQPEFMTPADRVQALWSKSGAPPLRSTVLQYEKRRLASPSQKSGIIDAQHPHNCGS
jgi:hypothetical protein